MKWGICFLCLLAPFPSLAGVHLSARCDDDAMQIGVAVINDGDLADYVGIVVRRSTVGICGAQRIVTSEPLPIPEQTFPVQEVVYALTDPAPAPDRGYWYTAMGLDSEGELHLVPGMGDPLPYDFAGCGEAVVSRGYLLYLFDGQQFRIGLFTCADGCWYYQAYAEPWFPDLGLVDPATYEQYVDSQVAVDLIGDIYVDGMPGATGAIVTAIRPSPGGVCGPLPNRPVSWGALKAHYR